MHLKWYSVQFMQFVVTFKACAAENGFVRFSFKNVKNFKSEKWVFGFILLTKQTLCNFKFSFFALVKECRM